MKCGAGKAKQRTTVGHCVLFCSVLFNNSEALPFGTSKK
jgi:hypothetical protein